jgi:hypothetical protein
MQHSGPKAGLVYHHRIGDEGIIGSEKLDVVSTYFRGLKLIRSLRHVSSRVASTTGAGGRKAYLRGIATGHGFDVSKLGAVVAKCIAQGKDRGLGKRSGFWPYYIHNRHIATGITRRLAPREAAS